MPSINCVLKLRSIKLLNDSLVSGKLRNTLNNKVLGIL